MNIVEYGEERLMVPELLATLSAFTLDETSLASLMQCTQPEQMFRALNAAQLVITATRTPEVVVKP